MIPAYEHLKEISLTTVEEIVRFVPFFREGHKVLSRLQGTGVTWEAYFRLITDVVTGAYEAGRVLVLCDCRSKPIFYLIAFDNTSRYGKIKTMLIFAAYSNNGHKKAARYGVENIEEWARELGYAELQAVSPRVTGAAFRLFENSFGFEKRSVLFFKAL